MHGLLLGMFLLAAPAPQAPNEHLDRAIQLMGSLDFAAAEEELAQARAQSENSRASFLQILDLTGEVLAVRGKHAEAVATFTQLLTIDPDHTPSQSWSPKVSTPFFEAKSWVAEHGSLKVRSAAPRVAGGSVAALRVELVADPAGLARAVRFHLKGQAAPQDRPATQAGMIDDKLAPQPQVTWWADLLGEHQEVLAQLGSAANPLVAGSAVTEVASSSAPYRPAAYALAGGGAVLLGVAGYFGAQVGSARSTVANAARDAQGRVTGITEAKALSLDNQAKQDAAIADALFAVGGIAAASGVSLWIWGAKVSAAPRAGGVSLALAVRTP